MFVGFITPLTGPYTSSGAGMKNGFELAVDHLNNGSPITEALPSLRKGKGVLGKKIGYQVADSETKPNTEAQAATRFINTSRAIMLCGGISSAVSSELEELGKHEKVVLMIGNSCSSGTTRTARATASAWRAVDRTAYRQCPLTR